jgi:YfiR/HmsC-like
VYVALLMMRRPAILAAALLAFTATGAGAQEVTAPELKAAFVANFAKFAEWPADAQREGQPFTYCVIQQNDVASALQVAGKKNQAGPFRVLTMTPDGPLRSCQVLYVGITDARDIAGVLDAVNGAAVFTIGESDGFAERGGVAQLVEQNGRMRFAINPGAARRAHLVLSAKLLSLAILVKDADHARR